MILSPPENEPLKYSPKLGSFLNAEKDPLSQNFQISPLQCHEQKSLFGAIYFRNQLKMLWERQ